MAAKLKQLEASLAERTSEDVEFRDQESDEDEDERREYEELMRVHGKPAASVAKKP